MINTSTPTLYTKKACPQCLGVSLFLKQRGITFNTVDVGENPAALEYLKSRGFLSVPVLKVEDKHIQGFNVPELEKL